MIKINGTSELGLVARAVEANSQLMAYALDAGDVFAEQYAQGMGVVLRDAREALAGRKR